MPKPKDAESTAIQTIALVLAPLTEHERERIAHWMYDRYVVAKPEPAPPAGPFI